VPSLEDRRFPVRELTGQRHLDITAPSLADLREAARPGLVLRGTDPQTYAKRGIASTGTFAAMGCWLARDLADTRSSARLFG
jgi:hypothetical protein